MSRNPKWSKSDLEYPYIIAWGLLTQSNVYYIRMQIAEARKCKAPLNATYRKSDGDWATINDCHIPI